MRDARHDATFQLTTIQRSSGWRKDSRRQLPGTDGTGVDPAGCRLPMGGVLRRSWRQSLRCRALEQFVCVARVGDPKNITNSKKGVPLRQR
jgi:hypothetical protein